MAKVTITSSKKDFIRVEWSTEDDEDLFSSQPSTSEIYGYRVWYQAVGTSYSQKYEISDPTARAFDIVQLSENTLYKVCLRVMHNSTHEGREIGCTEGSTRTDSVWVAVGSTLGAFVSLALIVLLVFLAKRQHRATRKTGLDSVPQGGILSVHELNDLQRDDYNDNDDNYDDDDVDNYNQIRTTDESHGTDDFHEEEKGGLRSTGHSELENFDRLELAQRRDGAEHLQASHSSRPDFSDDCNHRDCNVTLETKSLQLFLH